MEKSPDAFRTISEAADDLNLPQHVLRFWETRFSQIKPMKRGGGRRYYRPDDVDLLRGIRHLLYEEGYTIRGVQRILREQGNRFVIGIGSGEIDISDPAAMLAATSANETASPAPEPEVHPDASRDAPRQKAVTVEEYTERKGQKSSKGLLGRLRGGREEVDELPVSGGGNLSVEDRRNLQTTLYELLECKRLLDQVRSD
ncbi:MAG: MerR family transcriptional regulator [Nitratireductor sp.]|nr:MerR family transcriptional regulator [Nitratireductor sp.]